MNEKFYITFNLCYDDYYSTIEENFKNFGEYKGNIKNVIKDIREIKFEVDEENTDNGSTVLDPKIKNNENYLILHIIELMSDLISDFDESPEDYYYRFDNEISDFETLIDENEEIYLKSNIKGYDKCFKPIRIYADRLDADGYWWTNVAVEFVEIK